MLSTGRIVATVVVVSVCVVAAVVIPTAIVLTNNKKVNDEWNAFKEEFNKTYATEDEDDLRKENWLKNKEEVEKHNKLYDEGKESYRRILTADSDISTAERDALYDDLLCGRSAINVTGVPFKAKRRRSARNTIPDSFDWRDRGAVTGVKNQNVDDVKKKCKSCWAFATVGIVESYSYIKRSGETKLHEYSEQYLVDCASSASSKNGLGCSGGVRYSATMYVQGHGIPLSGDYAKYHASQSDCDESTPRQTIGFSGARQLMDEVEMKSEVAENGPISCGVRVDKEFEEYMSTGSDQGTYRPAGSCDATEGFHALTIIGYGTDTNDIDYWLIKNSWGDNVGDKGYIKLERGRNACGVADKAITLYI